MKKLILSDLNLCLFFTFLKYVNFAFHILFHFELHFVSLSRVHMSVIDRTEFVFNAFDSCVSKEANGS